MKKTAVLVLLIITSCLAFSQEAKKHNFWIDFCAGGTNMQEKDAINMIVLFGLNVEVKPPYYFSLHCALGASKDNSYGYLLPSLGGSSGYPSLDIQGGYIITKGPLRLYPAVGIGSATVGNNERKSQATVNFPLSCSFQCAFTQHFGIETVGIYNINPERNFWNAYFGIILGKLR